MDQINLTTFPYRRNPEGSYFPVIPVRIIFKDKARNTSALVDSGATISIFRTEIAVRLGIVIERGEETIMGGVGGRIKGYLHTVSIVAAEKKFSCPVIFSYEYLVSFNLLGRAGFFENFRVTFDEINQRVEII